MPSTPSSPTVDAAVPDPDRHTRTDAVEGDLKGRSVRSGFVKMAAQGGQLAIGVGSTMVLARLLTPEDFGLFAMVGALMAFIGSFKDFGLPMATVQQEEVSPRQVGALFWLNAKLNVAVALFMMAMAPVLAWFYGEARVVPITLVMAGGVFGLGLAVQHQSLLTRQMRFGALTAIEVGSAAAGAVAGIGAALWGASYWALVVQFLVTTLVSTTAAWWVCDWRPRWADRRRKGAELGSMLHFSGYYTGFSVFTHIGRNLDRVLVGYISGAAAMGLYDRAYRWSIFPINQLYTPLMSVAVAGLSRVQSDAARFRTYYRRGLLPVFAVSMPVLAFALVEGRAVVLVLLGEQWLAAVPLFQLLCLAAFMETINKVTKWLYLAQGQTQRQFRWGLIYTPVMIAAVALGANWGALGIAVGFTVGTSLLTYPAVAYCLKGVPLTLRDFGGIVWRPALGAALAAGGLYAARPFLPEVASPFVALLVTFPLFSALYAVCWIALPGGRAATRDVLRLLQELRPSRKSSSTDVQPPSPDVHPTPSDVRPTTPDVHPTADAERAAPNVSP